MSNDGGMDWLAPGHPDRPDHPDFWRLSELILKQDADSDTIDVDVMIGAVIDRDSLIYMARQRALRSLGIETSVGMTIRAKEIHAATALYIDAFLLGAAYQESRGGPTA